MEWYKGLEDITNLVVSGNKIYVLHKDQKAFSILEGMPLDDYVDYLVEKKKWRECARFLIRYEVCDFE